MNKKTLGIHIILQFLDWLTTKTALTMPRTRAREVNPVAKWFTDRNKWGTLLIIKMAMSIFPIFGARKMSKAEINKFNSGMKKMNWLYAFVVSNNAKIIYRELQNKKGAN